MKKYTFCENFLHRYRFFRNFANDFIKVFISNKLYTFKHKTNYTSVSDCIYRIEYK